jgi:outer membrane lipoprotein-sorting protein
MKAFRASVFSTWVMVFAAGCLSSGWADTGCDAKNFVAEIASVRGEFTQHKQMKILSKPLVSGGAFIFKTPDSLRWEYRYPFRSILLTHDAKRFVQSDGDLIEDSSSSLQFMQIVLQEITKWLKGRFGENPAFMPTFESGRKIALVPKEPSFAALIQRIEIMLSERRGVIESVTIYEGGESLTKFEFNHVTVNQPIEDSLFRQP